MTEQDPPLRPLIEDEQQEDADNVPEFPDPEWEYPLIHD